MAKEFVYNKVKELGTLGNDTIEIGHFTVDGKENADKVYRVTHFTRKGNVEDSRATAICSISEAKELAEVLKGVIDNG